MQTELQRKINNGDMILLSEISPPQSGDPKALTSISKEYAGKVCALGISDNKEEICMSAMAASSIVAKTGIEPIMHVITRDKNRIALISDFLGAQSLGIHNILLTSGTHQTLGPYKEAKNVFDIDSIQLIDMIHTLSQHGIAGKQEFSGINSTCIGATADPFADPLSLQIMKLTKKINAGAVFIITKPIFSINRFQTWWEKVKAFGLHEKAAIIAGVRVLTHKDEMQQLIQSRPDPVIPKEVIERMESQENPDAMKEEGIKIALETIETLTAMKGLRGFEIVSRDFSSIFSVIDRSALREKELEHI